MSPRKIRIIITNLTKTTRIRNLAAVLTALLMLSGCFSLPVEDLISPPKLSTEQTEIYKALLNGKGTGLTLKYPKTGEFRSPFVFFDSDVFVFYELSGETGEPAVWMTLLSHKNEKWECTYDISFFASDIEKVEFAEFGDGGGKNAVISCSVTGAPNKTVSVVALSPDGEPKKVYSKNYCLYYEINDYFSDRGNRIMTVVSKDTADAKEIRACFAAWKNGVFEEDDSVELNPDATGIVSVTPGFIGRRKPALFIEYAKGDNNFNTGVIARQSIGLYNAVYTPNEERRAGNVAALEKSPNANTVYAFSRDIDGDGITEAAGNADFPGYAGAGTVPLKAAVWYSFKSADALEKLYYTYMSLNGDYVFFFPEEWENRVTVSAASDGKDVTFWEYDGKKHEYFYNAEKELLRITAVPKSDPAPTDGDWRLFNARTNENYDYYVRFSSDWINIGELSDALVFKF